MAGRNTRTSSGITGINPLELDKAQLNKLNPNEKIIVSLLSNKIEELKKSFEEELLKRDHRIRELETEIARSNKNYAKLETKFDDLEAASKCNSLVISGGEVPVVNSHENCSLIVKNRIKNKLKYSISEEIQLTAFRVGPPPSTQKPDRRNLIVKMENEELVQDIVRTSKKVRPTNLYFSESLIPKRLAILQILRKLKRTNPDKISGCSSVRGRIFAWIPPPRPDAPGARVSKILVNTRSQLEDFCSKTLGIPLDKVLLDNPQIQID